MVDKWFISDTHFFHANILKFKNDNNDPNSPRIRACYSSVEEMHEDMVKKWNSVVKQGDKVYHLGDVTFCYDRPFKELMSRLNGSKRLILGNHDKVKGTVLLDYFDKLELWYGFHFKGEKKLNFTCSHIPVRLESLRDGNFNVHGHTHQNVLEDPHYINVCVEQIDYTPVHLDEILEVIRANV